MPCNRKHAAEGILRWRAQQQAEEDAPDIEDAVDSDTSEDSDREEQIRYLWQSAGYHAVLQTYTYRLGYYAKGHLLLVNPDTQHAMVVNFKHSSWYSSLTGIQNDWDTAAEWQGSFNELFQLADAQLDPKAAKLGRKLSPKDCDYARWAELYAAINVWKQAGCPLWKGRLTRTLYRWNYHKTPLAFQVQAAAYIQRAFRAWRVNVRNQAATRIQAAFRGWRFRLRILHNPNNELGQRYLSARFDRECQLP